MNSKELCKKSYEIVIPLESKDLTSSVKLPETEDSGPESCSEDEETFWKTVDILGKTELAKKVKRYQNPQTIPLKLDTFCRMETNYSVVDPCIEEAFILWEHDSWDEILKSGNLQNNKNTEDEGSDSYEDCGNSDSETEPEIAEFTNSLRLKRDCGVNVTGETLIYDEEYETVRNLHKESISLTSYGRLVHNHKDFGKQEFLFDKLSPEEQSMLKAEDFPKSESRNVETGAGDLFMKA